ncbi:NAD-dependent pyridoxamine 5'-phosphate oxidase/oxidoreductase [Oleiphilus messinensis]|uniref:NAD-dependent pyridoxamine 5'-phosphate oxidase/oxidoreductase n=1 Tax=Oleiphilus messinensis TaxID=141451 RepID=A0A1Y0IFD3_9GAMM|nr:pyridoxamine 5'-phosphate oxidase family protein [Oleiphilus messinensis]ARU58083.1 NAD-dependent pyridoxamine 5'-phosphate oxidase/oxidoreductase [Oleiphilus messinensis]
MTSRYAQLAFTPTIRQLQEQWGSRELYTRLDEGDERNHRMSARETSFIEVRDSFYMATVSETGWPYVQHRGGPEGFLRVLDESTLAFADFKGNRQYMSAGHLQHNDRVALFLMDYTRRRRLKIMGHASRVELSDGSLMNKVIDSAYPADVQWGTLIKVEAFDWNCPQHITPRFTEPEIEAMVQPLHDEINRLRTLLSKNGSAL